MNTEKVEYWNDGLLENIVTSYGLPYQIPAKSIHPSSRFLLWRTGSAERMALNYGLTPYALRLTCLPAGRRL